MTAPGLLSIKSVTLPGANWNLLVASHTEVFPSRALAQASELLQKWSNVFPHDDTWVGKTHGVPSLIVRLDCIVTDAGDLKVYEIEDRPCGIGISCHTVGGFKERLANLQKEWPLFRWVGDPDRVTDDFYWLGEGLTLAESLKGKDPVLVRSRPDNQSYYPLSSRAVSTVQHEGDKRCCADPALAMCSIIRWVEDRSEQSGGYIDPPVIQSSVIKPVQGTRAREVRVFVGNDGLQGYQLHRKARLSPGDLDRYVRTNRAAICQPFIPPMRRGFLPDKNLIHRLFFGYSPSDGRYVPLGGVWMASDSVIVHGQDGVISGPLECDG